MVKKVKEDLQKGVVTPNATQLKVADLGIVCHSKGVNEFTLLFDREQDVALNTQNKDGCRGERTEAFGKFGQVWRLIGWRGV